MLIYNTLTTSLISLSVNEYKRIFVDELYNEEEKKQLIKFGILINSKEDVLNEFKMLKKRDINKSYSKYKKRIFYFNRLFSCQSKKYYMFDG